MSEQSEEKAKKTPSTHDKKTKIAKNDRVELTEEELKRVSGGGKPPVPPDPC